MPITSFRSEKEMNGRLPSSPLEGTMNIRSCHMVLSMHLLFSVFHQLNLRRPPEPGCHWKHWFPNLFPNKRRAHPTCQDSPKPAPTEPELLEFHTTSTTFLWCIIIHQGVVGWTYPKSKQSPNGHSLSLSKNFNDFFLLQMSTEDISEITASLQSQ